MFTESVQTKRLLTKIKDSFFSLEFYNRNTSLDKAHRDLTSENGNLIKQNKKYGLHFFAKYRRLLKLFFPMKSYTRYKRLFRWKVSPCTAHTRVLYMQLTFMWPSNCHGLMLFQFCLTPTKDYQHDESVSVKLHICIYLLLREQFNGQDSFVFTCYCWEGDAETQDGALDAVNVQTDLWILYHNIKNISCLLMSFLQ